MIRNSSLYNKLTMTANNTWGTQGHGGSYRPFTTQATKLEIIDEGNIKVLYTTVANFPSKSLFEKALPKYRNEAKAAIDTACKKFVEDFNDRYKDDEYENEISVKILHATMTENVEYLSSSVYAPVQKGLYRVTCLAKIIS